MGGTHYHITTYSSNEMENALRDVFSKIMLQKDN